MTIVFATLTAIIILLQVFKHWFLYKGNLKLVYILNIAVFIGYFIIESTVAFNDPSQWPLIFMNIVNVFAIVMAIKGLMRIKEEENDRQPKASTKIESPNAGTPKKNDLSLAQKDWAGHMNINSSG
jgi:uncharacterized membrane protein YfcA